MPTDTPPRAVFLSYASQDAEAARRICDALRAEGVEVWFDQSELVGGDAWDQKIRRQIKECALFVPIISATTQGRREAYFRLEWKLADERTHLMAKGTPFILPVTIDETNDRGALVPESFLAVQWTRLPGGEASAAFCARVKKLLDGEVADVGRGRLTPPSGHAAGNGGVSDPALQRNRRSRSWLVPAILAVAAVVALALWRPWRGKESPATVAPPPVAKAVAATSAPTPAASDKSLVVLPFENLSPDPENALFTEGMHTEIISNLQLLSDLKVISRGRALAFKGSTAPIAGIAQQLGVAHVITGSVRREKNVVRITLELRRASDDALLWSLPRRD